MDRFKSSLSENAWLAGVFAIVAIVAMALYHQPGAQAAEADQTQAPPAPLVADLSEQQIAEAVRNSDLPGPLAQPSVFVVQRGERVTEIASRLEQEGIVNDSQTFLIAVYHMKQNHKLKAGTYNIKAKASVRDVIDMFVQGNPLVFNIVIPGDLTSSQIVQMLRGNPDLTGDILKIPPEGSLKPGTYRFVKGTTRTEMIQRMQAAQK